MAVKDLRRRRVANSRQDGSQEARGKGGGEEATGGWGKKGESFWGGRRWWVVALGSVGWRRVI